MKIYNYLRELSEDVNKSMTQCNRDLASWKIIKLTHPKTWVRIGYIVLKDSIKALVNKL